MTRREFAERLVMLADDFEMNCLPVGEVIQNIHDVEDALAKGDTQRYVEWLENEIEEYDGGSGWHDDEAEELLTALKEGDIHE